VSLILPFMGIGTSLTAGYFFCISLSLEEYVEEFSLFVFPLALLCLFLEELLPMLLCDGPSF
jgi:hypothetical protein